MNTQYPMSKFREHCQNCISFSISTFVTIRLGLYYYTNNVSYLSYLSHFISAHCLTDLFVAKQRDIQIHHIITLGMTSVFIKTGMCDLETNRDLIPIMCVFYSTELSTIFLTIHYCLENFVKNYKNNPFYHINKLVFTTLFFKTRIYDLWALLSETNTYTVFNSYIEDGSYLSIQFFGSIYWFWLLNLFWFSIICKKLYKNIIIGSFPQVNTEKMCSTIAAYTYISCLVYTIYNYYRNPYMIYLIDIFGATMLSISSYIYHTSCVESYDRVNVLDYISDRNMLPFLNDIFCIRVRSFLSLVVNIYSSMYAREYILLSMAANGMSFYYFIKTVLKYRIQGESIYNVDDPKFYTIMNIHKLTILGDIIIGCINTNDRICWFRMATFVVMLCIIGKITPFYNLNHVAIHMMLFFQTVWAIQCTNCALSFQSTS